MIQEKKGITLISVVITIILLLILAGISISSLKSVGIFEKTNEAKRKIAEKEENQTKVLNQYESEIDKYLDNQNELADKAKIGDYVIYIPDTLKDETLESLKDKLNMYSGKDGSEVNKAIKRDELKWRVLDIDKKTKQVRLISETPTNSKIELKGYDGYNNAVKLLDDACSTLYNNFNLTSKVQNLKIEDIITDMDIQRTKDETIYTPTNIRYPLIFEQEENQIVEDIKYSIKKIGVSYQNDFVTGFNTSDKNSFMSTDWSKKIDDINNKYYELFIEKENKKYSYWISSRCVYACSYAVYFRVHNVDSGGISARSLYFSRDDANSHNLAFRPVITLKSNVQVISGDGDKIPFVIK